MVSYSDSPISSSSSSNSSSGDVAVFIGVLILALIAIVIKFLWITLSVVGVIGVIVWIIIRSRSSKKAQEWSDSSERKELAEILRSQDERKRPDSALDKNVPSLSETFKYEWEIGGKKFIGTRKIESEQALRDHVARAGGKFIRLINDSCNESENDSLGTARIQEAFENYIDMKAVDLGVQNPDKLDTWDIGRLVTHPEVLPCAYDLTVGGWLYRLKFWGKPDITWFHPTTGEKEKMTESQLNYYLSGMEFLQNFGKWHLHKVSFKSFEMSRRWKGEDGKMIDEKIAVDIDLNDNVKQALKMKLG